MNFMGVEVGDAVHLGDIQVHWNPSDGRGLGVTEAHGVSRVHGNVFQYPDDPGTRGRCSSKQRRDLVRQGLCRRS